MYVAKGLYVVSLASALVTAPVQQRPETQRQPAARAHPWSPAALHGSHVSNATAHAFASSRARAPAGRFDVEAPAYPRAKAVMPLLDGGDADGDRAAARRPGGGPRSPNEFELNLGRCIDVLRSDFPEFYNRELDWSIYTRGIEVRDPSGVQVKGLDNYKNVFSTIRFFKRVMVDKVDLTYRLRYDWGAKRIVVQWYSRWYAMGSRVAASVDGVSYFLLDDEGFIERHEIDRVMVNGQALEPPYGLGAWLRGAQRGNPVAAHAAMLVPKLFPDVAFVAVDQAPALHFTAGADAPRGTALQAASDKEKSPVKVRKARKEKNPIARALDTCENIWDCDSPMQCCDFVVLKMCCNGKIGIPAFMPMPKPVPIPIPIPVDNFPRPPDRRNY
ncbi:hypothetical protein M885DRAFT_514526 [Pelagophyceae sp. CCMP2097]|nr:hypothetical protein M885DRAFT_514526 [Pelagophyceae sp. CCMP2097]